MISLLGVTRKNYTVTLDHGQSVSGTVSVGRRTVSIAPYSTSETVAVPEVTNVSGALASFPRSE